MNQLGRGSAPKAERFLELVPQDEVYVDVTAREAHEASKTIDISSLLSTAANVRSTELSFSNIHSYGSLFADYLRARREVFIERKGWDLPETGGMEFDQYDNGYTRWIVVHEYGQVVGGVRLYPTNEEVGLHSYMLRDAQLGLLKGLRQDFLYDRAPVSPLVWEATRLFVATTVASKQRAAIQMKIMAEMAKTARRNGATHIIGIVPAVFRRWLARIGMSATPVGPELKSEGDRVCAALFRAEDFKN